MTISRPCLFAIALGGAELSSAPTAGAQVHWDVGIQAGATERLTTGDARVPTPTPGPSGEIHAHIAVLPMLRVGPYAAFDLSPAPGRATRPIYAAGLRAKLTPPWLSAPWRAWAFLGVGFADAYTPRDAPVRSPTQAAPSDAVVEGFSTGMLELPVGIGLGYKLRGPWELYSELGARVVVAHGSIAGASGRGTPSAPLARDDLLAVSLSLGVSLAP
jgi:hypothetical protein